MAVDAGEEEEATIPADTDAVAREVEVVAAVVGTGANRSAT